MARVECYAGYQGDERPLRFHIGDRTVAVERILERWRRPEANGFRVSTPEGAYVLEQRVSDEIGRASCRERV